MNHYGAQRSQLGPAPGWSRARSSRITPSTSNPYAVEAIRAHPVRWARRPATAPETPSESTPPKTITWMIRTYEIPRMLSTTRVTRGPVWSRRLGISYAQQPNQLRFCGGSSAFNASSKTLLVGANQDSLSSTVLGSAYSLNPDTGAVRWRTGLPNRPVIGSVSVNGAGVVAAPTYNAGTTSGAVYLLAESTGAILRTLTTTAPVFAQPAFTDGYLLVAAGARLTAHRP